MVVGVRKSLEEGRTYAFDDLAKRFGMSGAAFERVLDHLVEQGCLKPVIFDCRGGKGSAVRLAAHRESLLRWEA
jgi:ribosomal protein S25